MTFKEWLLSSYPNPSKNGQWGLLHIITLVLAIAIIFAVSLLFKNKSERSKRIILWVCFSLILAFEIIRRIINLAKTETFTLNGVLYTLLPRPWCAISCWSIILAVLCNKKFMYNFASTTSLLCALIFFAYPGAGFNNQYILFENLYSIGTHTLLLITSILMITLGFAQFEYKNIWKESIYLVLVYLYAFIEMFVLKICNDPMYFMPGGDIQDIIGVNYPTYLVIYIVFVMVYFNIFYLIGDRKNVFKKHR